MCHRERGGRRRGGRRVEEGREEGGGRKEGGRRRGREEGEGGEKREGGGEGGHTLQLRSWVSRMFLAARSLCTKLFLAR